MFIAYSDVTIYIQISYSLSFMFVQDVNLETWSKGTDDL